MARFSRHAVLEWSGDVVRGAGTVTAGNAAFTVPASFPRLGGDPAGVTTPEEMLAASHAICYGLGLRSVIGSRGGTARRIVVTATVTAEKSTGGIRVESSHLHGIVEGLEGLDPATIDDIARATEEACTISNAIRGSVTITCSVSVT